MAWTDYYVDLAATGGTPDGSTSAPWQSYEACCAALETAWSSLTAPSSTRIFVRGNGSLGGAQDIDLIGTATINIEWVGCTGSGTTWTRIGDVDSTSRPTLDCSTYQCVFSGGYVIFEGLSFTSAYAGANGAMRGTGRCQTFVRCRFNATGNNTGSYALSCEGSESRVISCYAKSTYGARALSSASTYGHVIACHADGIIPIYSSGVAASVLFNTVKGGTGIGLQVAGSASVCMNNTVYGSDNTGISAAFAIVGNNVCVGDGSMDYPIATGANDARCVIMRNMWYNVVTNRIDGPDETQSTHAGAADDYGSCFANYGLAASDPLTDGAGGDYSLASAFQGLAVPGSFEGFTTSVGHLDHGAVQHADPAGGGGIWMPRARQVGV